MPPASPTDIVKGILAGTSSPPVILILAPDIVRKDRIIKRIEEKFFPSKELGTLHLLGSDLDKRGVVQLRDELLSGSLFAPTRLIVVSEIEELRAEPTKALLTLIEETGKQKTGSTLLLHGKSLAANSVISKSAKSYGVVVDLGEMSEDEIKGWVSKELRAFGVTNAGAGVVETLIEYTSGSPDELHKLIQHLALYVEDGKATTNDLVSLFPERISPNEYQLLDLISGRRRAGAEVLVSNLLRSGKNPFLLLSLVSRNISTWFEIAALQEQGRSPFEIGKHLKIPDWLLKKHINSVRPYRLERLKAAIGAALKADSKLKNRSLGPDAIFSELICGVMP